MSRPANPTYSTRTFAEDANYPAGAEAWSNQPTKAEPPGATTTGFVPDTGDAAEYRNKLFNETFAQHRSAKTKLDEIVTFVGQGPAIDIHSETTFADVPQYAHFNTKIAGWQVGGEDGTDKSSQDNRTWDAGVLASAGTEDIRGSDFKASNGDSAYSTNTRYVLKYVSGVAGKVDVHGAALTAVGSAIAFDPVSGLWCWAACDSSNTFIRTSSDLTTWTVRSTPASFTTGVTRLVCKKSTGKLVLAQALGAGAADSVYVSTSSDGGVTWTATATITGVNTTHMFLAHNETTNKWLLTTGNPSGPSCKVYESADGVTWSLVCTLAASCMLAMGGMGNMWIGLFNSGYPELGYSLDNGTTWKKSGLRLTGTAKLLFTGGGGFVALTSSRVYTGRRCGEPGVGSFA